MSTHYPLRSGHSNNGAACGVFYVDATIDASYISLRISAALSFGLSTHYAARGGASAYVDTCGIFFITLNPLYSTGNWVYGAALLYWYTLCCSWWCF